MNILVIYLIALFQNICVFINIIIVFIFVDGWMDGLWERESGRELVREREEVVKDPDLF